MLSDVRCLTNPDWVFEDLPRHVDRLSRERLACAGRDQDSLRRILSTAASRPGSPPSPAPRSSSQKDPCVLLSQILPEADPLPPDLIASIQDSLIRTEAVDAFADWHDAAALRTFLSCPQSAVFRPALSLTLFGEPATPASQGIPSRRPFTTIAAAWAAARDHFHLGTDTDRLVLRLLVLADGGLTLDACRADHWGRRGPDRAAELYEPLAAAPGL